LRAELKVERLRNLQGSLLLQQKNILHFSDV
jgi:hypothetical protein